MDHRRWEYYWIAVLILASFMVMRKSPEQRKHNHQVRQRERFATKMQSHMKCRTKIVYGNDGSISLRPAWYRRLYYNKMVRMTIIIFSLTVVMIVIAKWFDLPIPVPLIGANRYWVGGGGYWSGSDTWHFSYDSGQAADEAYQPVNGDVVIFDDNSGSMGSVYVDVSTATVSVTWTASPDNLVLSGSGGTLNLSGTCNFSGHDNYFNNLSISIEGTTTLTCMQYQNVILNVNANLTVASDNLYIVTTFTVQSGKTVTINSSYRLICWASGPSNLGTITGTGTFFFACGNSSVTIANVGTYSCTEVWFAQVPGVSAARTFTINTSLWTIGTNVHIENQDASRTFTVQINGAGTISGDFTDYTYGGTLNYQSNGTVEKTISCTGTVTLDDATINDAYASFKYTGTTSINWTFKDTAVVGSITVNSGDIARVLTILSGLKVRRWIATTGTIKLTAGKTYYMQSGNTSTVAANSKIDISGTLGNVITLRINGITSVHWNLNRNASGTVTVTYVDVADSDASYGSEIDASDGTNVDSLNNHNWDFGGAAAGTPSSGSSAARLMAAGAI